MPRRHKPTWNILHSHIKTNTWLLSACEQVLLIVVRRRCGSIVPHEVLVSDPVLDLVVLIVGHALDLVVRVHPVVQVVDLATAAIHNYIFITDWRLDRCGRSQNRAHI